MREFCLLFSPSPSTLLPPAVSWPLMGFSTCARKHTHSYTLKQLDQRLKKRRPGWLFHALATLSCFPGILTQVPSFCSVWRLTALTHWRSTGQIKKNKQTNKQNAWTYFRVTYIDYNENKAVNSILAPLGRSLIRHLPRGRVWNVR